ncbi:Proline-rich protein PRCC [Acipenser ruthenus]|uniref:Proline-rich protein PRCC n=1 Tax=Acipenser ruthenus TaxID=7906 RepID=A0A444UV75_ACIRT|nr:Proline-rich protein PRCC [Acipenser ruthenus]
MVVKETHRPLVPHTLTKRKPEPRAPARASVTAAAAAASSVSSSPSAIKAAAKSAALQLARQMAQEDDAEEEECSDEDLDPKNYFSLPEKGSPLPEPDPVAPPGTEFPPGAFQSDAPLDFGPACATWNHQQGEQYYTPYPEAAGQNPSQEGYYQDYYSSGVEDSDPALPQAAASGSSSLIDDEAFRRLQGKRNRGKEEVTFLEIKGDDQLSGSQQWLTKGLTEEKEQRKNPNSESKRLDLGGFNLPPPKQSGSLRLPPPRDGSEKPWIPQPFPKSDSRLDPDYNPGESKLGFPAPKNSNFGLSLPPPIGGVGLNLPRPKKRAEPVKITVPEIHQGERTLNSVAPSSRDPNRLTRVKGYNFPA